jgi:hypothetical protein
MVALRRISVVLSLALYLVATTAVHALHNHSTSDCCDHAEHGHCCADDGDCDDCPSVAQDSTHAGPPLHSRHCEDSCFACRFLAAKSIAPVAVTIVEHSEIVRPLDPPRYVFVSPVGPDLPPSRGPPAA